MNRDAREPECPRAGAVLAIHLDGDVDESGFGFVCGETLAAHLRECSSCQRLLQRARRLDAALAGSAGRTLAEHLATIDAVAKRWFAAATAAPAPGAPCAEAGSPVMAGIATAGTHDVDPRQRVATWSAAACVLVCAITAVVLLRDPSPAPALAPATPAPAAPITEPAPVGTPQAVLIAAATPCDDAPADGRPAAAPPSTCSGLVIAADAVRCARREPRAAPDQLSALPLPELQRRVTDAGTAPQARVAAARALFAACHPFSPDARNATRVLVDLLASCGNRSAAERLLHGDLLDMARSTPHFLSWLQARLGQLGARVTRRDDLAVVAVATRLDDRELDLAVRRAVRKDPSLATTLAAALRGGLREDRAAALLLDAWHDLAARGALADDATAAWSWFGGQPNCVFDDLGHELHDSRAAPRRLRCILGLGCAADDRTVPILLELLQGNDHAEAHAAAFALAGLPHRCLRSLLPRATGNDGLFLLRAALARSALPETRSWPFVMALTPAERQLLSRATLAQFPVVAGWFRDRTTLLSD
ncbi:MAG TPA: hypothetical protein VFT55_07475 [Planctomycetota bacterium]|nr:hypothetical protein [Planctomycetota bacterium]